MYETFYGLRERPFSLTPDPRFLYMTARHREALSNLTYGIVGSRSITLVIGEAGTGKTTLIQAALANAQPGASYVIVNNPTLTRAEFLSLLASKFNLSADASTSKAAWLVEFEQLLRQRHADQLVTALVVDEAQSLSDELLEEVRLLSNIETNTEKLLPIVLTAQPELATRLNQPSLRQFKQRIALRCDLTPFDLAATASYVASRLQIAGGTPAQIFTRNAVVALHEASHGIPRTLNVLADNALLSGFAAGERPVGHRIVAEVSRDFQFIAGSNGRSGHSAVHDNGSAAAASSSAVVPSDQRTPSASMEVTAAAPPGPARPLGESEIVPTYPNRPRRLSFLWTKS